MGNMTKLNFRLVLTKGVTSGGGYHLSARRGVEVKINGCFVVANGDWQGVGMVIDRVWEW